MSLGSKTVFIFGHLPANPPFWKRLSLVHGRVYQKEQALEVSKCSFSERTTSYELHAAVLVLWNSAHNKRYHLVRDQVKCNMWPVKMAIGHFPTESHNFAWNGHVNIDGMTTVTLQTKYDPTLPSGYPKVAYPLEMSSGSGIYSDAVSHLPGAQHRPRSYRPITSMLFTVTSSPGHVNHVATIMTLLSFTEFWNLYCPRTIRFS